MPFENEKVRIGPTGVQKDLFKMPDSKGNLRYGKREELPPYLASLGLNAYEFPAGRMTKFNNGPTYEKFRENTKQNDIAISIHAPYYISLTSDQPEIFASSVERLAHTYAWATYLNAKRIVFHPGSYGGQNSHSKPSHKPDSKQTTLFQKPAPQKPKLIAQIVEGIKSGMAMAADLYPTLKHAFQEICLCPETMGKQGQLGTIDEVLTICKEIGIARVRPCVDFGHIYARNTGLVDGERLFTPVFTAIESELGKEVIQHLHIHYSKIEYSNRGEVKHHGNSTEEWGPTVNALFEYIHDQNLTPIIINESPELEPDAVLLQQKWRKICDNRR